MSSSNLIPPGKRGEAGPTHVLVVRGLDENADEEMLRYEFSKHAPIKVYLTDIYCAGYDFFCGYKCILLCFFLQLKMWNLFIYVGSSTGQGQIHSCFKRVCFCAFLLGMFFGKLCLEKFVNI